MLESGEEHGEALEVMAGSSQGSGRKGRGEGGEGRRGGCRNCYASVLLLIRIAVVGCRAESQFGVVGGEEVVVVEEA